MGNGLLPAKGHLNYYFLNSFPPSFYILKIKWQQNCKNLLMFGIYLPFSRYFIGFLFHFALA